MTKKLLCQAMMKFVLSIAILGVLTFLPAGTFCWWNAWLFAGILFVPMFVTGAIMLFKSPELLRKRLNAKEEQAEQSLVTKLSGLMFLLGFVAAGFNFRWQWIVLPGWVSWVAAAIFLFGYMVFAEVLRENAYLSRTVEVQENQKVIDTGLYGVIRHPMYGATLVLSLAMPLVLGSLPSFVIFLTYPMIIAKRISNEEKVLEEELSGYVEYKGRVKYKLIPFLW